MTRWSRKEVEGLQASEERMRPGRSGPRRQARWPVSFHTFRIPAIFSDPEKLSSLEQTVWDPKRNARERREARLRTEVGEAVMVETEEDDPAGKL